MTKNSNHAINQKLHITNAVKKCFKKIRIIKKLLSTPWGYNEKTLLQFYKSHKRLQFEFGLIVYVLCKDQDAKIETTQNYIIHLIFGLRKPTSTKFLLTESGLSAINERRKFLLINSEAPFGWGRGGQMPTPDFPGGPSFHQKGSFAGHNYNTICY